LVVVLVLAGGGEANRGVAGVFDDRSRRDRVVGSRGRHLAFVAFAGNFRRRFGRRGRRSRGGSGHDKHRQIDQ